MIKVVLAGNAVTADILMHYLRRDGRYEVVGATVDDAYVSEGGLQGVPTVGLSEVQARFPTADHRVIMAAGYNDLNRVREWLFRSLKELGYAIETYVHPDARVYSDLPLGEGSVLLPTAVIEPFARVGANAVVWCKATVAHHSVVGEHCWVASGAVLSGKAALGRNTFVGVNATVVNEVNVGDFNVIGGGALVTKNTKPNTVHLARSAEPLRYSSEDYVKFFGV
jgi:sugar O-acyltransferase (sialic acid O-acetyltransferase NeuD family)